MKNVIYSVAKVVARWVLGYAGTAASAALNKANERLQDKAYSANLVSWSHDTACLLAEFSGALEDASVSDEERDRVAVAAQALADRLAAFMD